MVEIQGVSIEPPEQHTHTTHTTNKTAQNINISIIGAAPLLTLHKKKKLEVFSLSLYEINQALKQPGDGPVKVDIRKIVPEHFHAEFLHLFDKAKANELCNGRMT
jgi:hypothetical protein